MKIDASGPKKAPGTRIKVKENAKTEYVPLSNEKKPKCK